MLDLRMLHSTIFITFWNLTITPRNYLGVRWWERRQGLKFSLKLFFSLLTQLHLSFFKCTAKCNMHTEPIISQPYLTRKWFAAGLLDVCQKYRRYPSLSFKFLHVVLTLNNLHRHQKLVRANTSSPSWLITVLAFPTRNLQSPTCFWGGTRQLQHNLRHCFRAYACSHHR